MVEKWEVIIFNVNSRGTPIIETFECDNLLQASRIVLTYKIRRGHTVSEYHIKRVVRLV